MFSVKLPSSASEPASARSRPASALPNTILVDWMNDSRGIAAKASANGSMKPITICPIDGIQRSAACTCCTPASDAVSASRSAASRSRM